MKVSFDYDGTLSTEEGQNLFKRTIGEKYVITSRLPSDRYEVYEVTDRLRIPRDRVFFTGSNWNKVKQIESLKIDIHYDNNLGVATALKSKGRYFHP
jgi:hypothetical protein